MPLKTPERLLVKALKPATSYGEGRKGKAPRFVVIHVTQAMKLSSTDNWFTHPNCPVSAHYGIDRDGTVHQYVSEKNTAYHAGNIVMNRESIGIEHAGLSGTAFTKEQVQVSAQLTARICRGYGIPIDNIIPHGSIKGTTHTGCPGPTWDMPAYKKLVQHYINEYNSKG